MNEPIKLHCWADRYEVETAAAVTALERLDAGTREASEGSLTCFLEDGHDGPHKWTPDSDVSMTFAPMEATR